jgi:K+-transporting ATPase ATPase C chain
MKTMKESIQKSIILVLLMTLLCGVIYPMLVTGIAQLFFQNKANGSMIEVGGKTYGSELLGQQFTGDKYLWGRMMDMNMDLFTDSDGSKLMYAGPSNISTTSDEFKQTVSARVDQIKRANPASVNEKIPVDLVTNSGSGLDPQISYDAATYQVERVAKARNMSVQQVQQIIDKYTTDRFAGIFGEKVVNVLDVNLALDGILK